MNDTSKSRLEILEDENLFVGESFSDFSQGVLKVLNNLQLPAIDSVLKNFIKASVVTIISAILFSIIDSIVAPIAGFLING
jgi:uncharacterized membrane protein (DUF106 family)